MLGPSVMIVRTPRHHTSAAIGGMPAESCLVASEHAGDRGYGRRIEEFPCAHLRKGSAFRVVLDRKPEHPASLPSSTVCLQTTARVFAGDTHAEGKIVSLFEPSTEVIRDLRYRFHAGRYLRSRSIKPRDVDNLARADARRERIAVVLEDIVKLLR